MEDFIKAYIICALWASYGGNDEKELYIEDLSDEAREKLTADATAFFNANHEYFQGNESQAGHDFWLTRNRHGAGFWDNPEIYGDENARYLTDRSHEAGECSLYYWDDGSIYHYHG